MTNIMSGSGNKQTRGLSSKEISWITYIGRADAYLTRLAASGEEWELNGRARDAARLIALLEGSSLLTDVRFRTATTRVRVGGDELETFTVVFRHVPAT